MFCPGFHHEAGRLVIMVLNCPWARTPLIIQEFGALIILKAFPGDSSRPVCPLIFEHHICRIGSVLVSTPAEQDCLFRQPTSVENICQDSCQTAALLLWRQTNTSTVFTHFLNWNDSVTEGMGIIKLDLLAEQSDSSWDLKWLHELYCGRQTRQVNHHYVTKSLGLQFVFSPTRRHCWVRSSYRCPESHLSVLPTMLSLTQMGNSWNQNSQKYF